MARTAARIGAELVPVVLVLACLGGTAGLVIEFHRRQPGPEPQPVASAPEPEPVVAAAPVRKAEPEPEPEPEDPTPALVAAIDAETDAARTQARAAAERAAEAERALGALEARAGTLRQRIGQAHDVLAARVDQAAKLVAEADELARERDILVQRREAEKSRLARSQARAQDAYAILPYRGATGTWRRPIPIECRDDQAIIQPSGPAFSRLELGGLTSRSSPIVAAVGRELGRIESQGAPDGSPLVPYVLFVVRPNGVKAYYEARGRLEALGVAFGYELVDADTPLDFPDLNDAAEWPGVAPGTAAPSWPPAPAAGGGLAARRAGDRPGSGGPSGLPVGPGAGRLPTRELPGGILPGGAGRSFAELERQELRSDPAGELITRSTPPRPRMLSDLDRDGQPDGKGNGLRNGHGTGEGLRSRLAGGPPIPQIVDPRRPDGSATPGGGLDPAGERALPGRGLAGGRAELEPPGVAGGPGAGGGLTPGTERLAGPGGVATGEPGGRGQGGLTEGVGGSLAAGAPANGPAAVGSPVLADQGVKPPGLGQDPGGRPGALGGGGPGSGAAGGPEGLLAGSAAGGVGTPGAAAPSGRSAAGGAAGAEGPIAPGPAGQSTAGASMAGATAPGTQPGRTALGGSSGLAAIPPGEAGASASGLAELAVGQAGASGPAGTEPGATASGSSALAGPAGATTDPASRPYSEGLAALERELSGQAGPDTDALDRALERLEGRGRSGRGTGGQGGAGGSASGVGRGPAGVAPGQVAGGRGAAEGLGVGPSVLGGGGAAGAAGGASGGSGQPGGGLAGAAGGGSAGSAGAGLPGAGGGVSMERPVDLDLTCGPNGVTIEPGGYRISLKALESGELLRPRLEAIIERHAAARNGIASLPRPVIHYRVEPGGESTFWQVRRQMTFSGQDWPSTLNLAEGPTPAAAWLKGVRR